MYVRFMTNHPVNPEVVERLTNHPNTRLEPLDTLMNDNSENEACIYNISIVSPQKPNRQLTQNKTASRGNPFFVHLVKILGACPLKAKP